MRHKSSSVPAVRQRGNSDLKGHLSSVWIAITGPCIHSVSKSVWILCLAAQSCPALARLFCPWDYPSKNTGVGCHFLPRGIFPTQGSNLQLLHWQEDSLLQSQLGSQSESCTLGKPLEPVAWHMLSASISPTCFSTAPLNDENASAERWESACLKGRKPAQIWTSELLLLQLETRPPFLIGQWWPLKREKAPANIWFWL